MNIDECETGDYECPDKKSCSDTEGWDPRDLKSHWTDESDYP